MWLEKIWRVIKLLSQIPVIHQPFWEQQLPSTLEILIVSVYLFFVLKQVLLDANITFEQSRYVFLENAGLTMVVTVILSTQIAEGFSARVVGGEC